MIPVFLAEDLLGSFFGRRVHPSSADIQGAPAAPQPPAVASWQLPDLAGAAAAVATQLGGTKDGGAPQSPGRNRVLSAKAEPRSFNNIVPCPASQSGLVFSRPLHLGLPSPLLRDMLSGARGELSSMSLEMADTDAWLFRNDAGRRPRCSAAAAAATRLACSSVHKISTASTLPEASPQPLAASMVDDAPTKLDSRSTFVKADRRQRLWGTSAKAATVQAQHSPGLAAGAVYVQAPRPASGDSQGGALAQGDPLSSPCSCISSSSSLSSLDSEEEAALAAAGHLLGQIDGLKCDAAATILRRARLLASAFLLPVAVLGEYVPIGQQWSLAKPAQLRGALTDVGDVSAELASDMSRVDALQRRLRTIFWMHRLPVYRARLRDIYDSMYGGGPNAGK